MCYVINRGVELRIANEYLTVGSQAISTLTGVVATDRSRDVGQRLGAIAGVSASPSKLSTDGY